MKIVKESLNEKFYEISDPVKDMNIGLSIPKLILYTLVDMVGDNPIIHKDKTINKLYIEQYISLTSNEWKELRKTVDLRRIHKKYIKHAYDKMTGISSPEFNYLNLFNDAFGNGHGYFYYDDADLVFIDKSIINLAKFPNITFAELVEHVENFFITKNKI